MKPKRLISLLVAVCMMITMLPLSAVTAFAADTSPSTVYHEASDGTYKYYYTINADGKTATITNFRGPVDSKNTGPYNITIPTDLNYIPVTGIGNYAFYGRSALANVTIPQGITSIGDSAFLDCDTLISATIEEGVPTGTNMFNGCDNLATVKLPESLTTIATGSFASCPALNHVTIPDNVTTIGTSAFSLCNGLSDITLGRGLTTIGDFAFKNCDSLETIQLPSNLKKIGEEAFRECDILKSITLPDSVTDIGEAAFSTCPELESITIPENVTTIKSGTFDYCSKLTSITLPAGLTSFQDDLTGCLAGYLQATDIKTDENGQPILDKDGNRIYIYTPHGAIYFNNNRDTAEQLEGYDVLKDRNFLCLCHVTFDANGGKTDYDKVPVYETEKITDTKANELTAINAPTRAGYNFTGWYTADGKLADGKLENGKLFNVKDTAITDDITLYAGWEPAPKAPVCHPLTVTGGIVTVKNGDKDVTDTLTVTTDETTGKKTYSVPDGATVTVTLDKTLIPEGMVFDIWSTGKFSLPLGQDYKAETITFTMNTMSSDADIAAQYRDATIEDDGPNVLGTAAIIGTAAVGGAVLGYQAYSLGAEFAGKLMALPYFPSNRSALAMMLWEDAGKPMPESELLYPDVGQEEQDMDLQHAARWAMENELIPDLNDEGTAPEEMKFFPANPVSKLDVLNAWQKAQELKNN
ncbi:MAG: leucine-rich repeat protein [Faecalibacterium prausnitzii]|nr:leucine-rich repeat protein [Faecalibacterium prausnitzii]